MIDGQRLDRLAEIAQFLVPDADPQQSAIVLHHVHARAPVRRIDHNVHRAIDGEDIAQRAKTRVRVAQMMKHSRTDDLVERLAEVSNPLNRKPVELQISYVVLVLQIAGVAQARLADVDCGHARVRLGERVASGLRRSAPSN